MTRSKAWAELGQGLKFTLTVYNFLFFYFSPLKNNGKVHLHSQYQICLFLFLWSSHCVLSRKRQVANVEEKIVIES